MAPLRSQSDPVKERIEDFDGGFRIHTEQNCDDTIAAVHAASEMFKKKTKTGHRFAGSVPLVKALEWAKECGAPIASREWNAYATKKLNSGEFSKFKVAR